jgi:hypothetical protein
MSTSTPDPSPAGGTWDRHEVDQGTESGPSLIRPGTDDRHGEEGSYDHQLPLSPRPATA